MTDSPANTPGGGLQGLCADIEVFWCQDCFCWGTGWLSMAKVVALSSIDEARSSSVVSLARLSCFNLEYLDGAGLTGKV